MAKSLLVVGALCAFTAVDAFLPTCSRVVAPSTRASAWATSSMSLGSSQLVHRFGTKAAKRDARNELFSASAASDEKVTPPALPTGASMEKEVKAPAGTLKVTAYFGLWYLFNIGYNIYNKRVLNVLPLPWIIASAQLGIGLLYVFPLWATKLRKAPKLAKGALGPLRYDPIVDTMILLNLFRARESWFVCCNVCGRQGALSAQAWDASHSKRAGAVLS